MYSPVKLLCKDETGQVLEWASSQNVHFASYHQKVSRKGDAPLVRVKQIFNVNHFIVSQARPYIAPFLRSNLQRPDIQQSMIETVLSYSIRILAMEIAFRLRQLDRFGLVPRSIRRLLFDETIPGPSLTVVPQIRLQDLPKLLETPTKDSLRHWTALGERSVWPAVSSLRTRCSVEMEIEKACRTVKATKYPTYIASLSEPSTSVSTSRRSSIRKP